MNTYENPFALGDTPEQPKFEKLYSKDIPGFYREKLNYPFDLQKYRGVQLFEEENPAMQGSERYNINREASVRIGAVKQWLGEATAGLLAAGFSPESLVEISYYGRKPGNYGNHPQLTFIEIKDGENLEVTAQETGKMGTNVGIYESVLRRMASCIPLDERIKEDSMLLGKLNQEIATYLSEVEKYYQNTYHSEEAKS